MPSHSPVRISALLCGAAVSAASFGGQDLLWQTPYPAGLNFTTSYSIVHGGQTSRDQEVADDFNAHGLVERVVAPGGGCFMCAPPVVDGAVVRFYEWTQSGPGALQHESYVPLGQGFTHTGTYPGQLTINLPRPFQATGWHFVSVQVKFGDATGGIWDFVQTNRAGHINAPVQFRNNLAGGVWRQDGPPGGTPYNADFTISLYGQAGATEPMISSASRTTVTGSDRIIIHGQEFGSPGNGEFLINGVPGLVRRWSGMEIVGYVPEGLTPGPAELTVVNLGVSSDPLPITIITREANGRVKWVFEGDGDYVSFPPTVAPDSRVYFSDIDGDLYALSEDGALLWIVDALLGQEGSADECPVQVGSDGAVYVATNPLGPTVELVAFNPNGSHKWTFTSPQGQTWQAGPTIGPDGRLYAALNGSTQFGLDHDVLAINTDGTIAWTSAADPFVLEQAPEGSSVVFGPSSPGGSAIQMMFSANRFGDGRVYGFDISDGQQTFAAPTPGTNGVQRRQVAAAPTSGDFYMLEFQGVGGAGWGLQAFDSDGDRIWRFDPGIAVDATNPVVGPNGVIYFGWDLGRLTAVTPGNNEMWTKEQPVIYQAPVPSPTAPIVLALAKHDFVGPSFMEARSAANGEVVWSQALEDDTGADVGVYTKANFTPDGSAAYFSTLEAPLLSGSVFRIFAVDTSNGACPGDTNGDGVVNFADLNTVLSQFGQSGAPGSLTGDVNNDGSVNFADLNIVLSNFGMVC